jgi:hypothetical protein
VLEPHLSILLEKKAFCLGLGYRWLVGSFLLLAQGWQAYGNVKRWTLAKIPTEIFFSVLCFIMAGTALCFVLLRLFCGYDESGMFGVLTARSVFYS